MIQRLIQSALTIGWQSYLADSTLFTSLFSDIWELPDAEVAAITAYFATNPPDIYQGYPRAALGKKPACYITLAGEQQPDFALNDYGGSAQVTGPAGTPAAGTLVAGNSLLSSYWTHSYSILIVAPGQPEPALWAYEVCKSVLLAAKLFFMARAVLNYSLAGGDVAPETAYAPDTLFARTLTFRCQREFSQVEQNTTLQRAFAVKGLVLPPGGDPLPGRPDSHISVALPATPDT